MKTFVVIPAHNEGKNIADVIRKVKKYQKNIIVVDDGSDDKTALVAKKTGVKTLKLLINMGKGFALKVGCDYAYNNNADAIILIDSDGQHDPADIPRLMNALKGNDIVFAYRDIMKGSMPLILRLGNIGLNTQIRVLFDMSIKDTQCGFKAFTRKAYQKIRWSSNDYSVESEIIAKTGANKLKYVQVPIATVYKDKYKGTTVISGLVTGAKMFWWKIVK